jgi:shikimate dehydrogenase
MQTAVPEIFSAEDFLSNPGGFANFDPPVRLAVMGDPVAHSRSPGFQNAALHFCGIRARYTRLHVPPVRFGEVLRGLPAAGFLGANVTIPHKAAALEGVDKADAYAKASGSVNTVVVNGDKLMGFNTDGPGLSRAIREEFSVDLRDLRVVLLGAGGGAGRAIAVQCAMERCERLVLVNRTLDKARALATELAPYFHSERLSGPAERIVAIPFDDDSLRRELDNADILINATSLGMKRTDPPVLSPSLLTANLLVYDTVYAGGTSRLLEDAAAAGARVANGLGMLLHQGALSFEIWFNRPAPLEEMRRALHSTL